MRPHQLRLTAFGPFGGEVDVDFDAMAAGGLFLLQGDTGAGKTSILDGLAFALYGQVPGQRSGARRLRSDHADPGVRTSVELEVTIGRRRLRVSRSPEQERPKQRGAGTTRDPAKVLLQEAVDGGWRTVSTRVGEVDAELLGLLGMSADQFHQVVLLPQGEFARFLRSDAAERAHLLQRLFSTDRFRRVEEWLADRRRACTAELEAAVAGVQRLAARVAQAAGVDEPPVAHDELPAASWAGELAVAAVGAAEAQQAEAEAAGSCAAEAERRLRETQDLQRRQRRRAELLERQAGVERGRPLVTALLSGLDAARRALAVQSDLEQVARRRVTAERLRTELRQAYAGVAALVPSAAGPDELRRDGERRRRLLGQLDAAQRLEDDLVAERERSAVAHRAAAAAGSRAERHRRELADVPARIEHLRAAVDDAVEAQLRVPEVESERQRLLRAARAASALTVARQRRSQAAETLLTARETSALRREEAARLRVERYDFMIAELAAGLVDGDPCAVCGATEHPDPSDVRGSRVTKEQEDAARAAADEAQHVVADLSAAVAGLDAEIAGLQQSLVDADASDQSAETLQRLVAEAGTTVAALRCRSEAADALRRQLDEAQQAERNLSQTL
ncbi:MAG TPA: SMC family ATPase, partial [Frankiaceae bacterium]|nr:SMC family ATPase [Frankiaceae bacterium]